MKRMVYKAHVHINLTGKLKKDNVTFLRGK